MPPTAIYLDHNATAPMLPEVADAVREAALRFPGNPASQHEAGRLARRALESARQRIGEILGANTSGMNADQIIFTSGGTESNNLALNGLLPLQPRTKPGAADAIRSRLVISAIEHPSIFRAAEHLSTCEISINTSEVDSRGIVCLEHIERLLDSGLSGPLPLVGRAGEGERSGYTLQSPLPSASHGLPHLRSVGPVDRARLVPPHQGEGTGGRQIAPQRNGPKRRNLVSVMLASNETGVLQPVQEIAALCRAREVLIHTDAVQAVGRIPVSFQQLGVDALTAAAHKFHGPLGVGVLILRHGVALEPTLFGGFQQGGLRPGTESVSLAIGMQAALELWQREAEPRQSRMAALRDRFEHLVLTGYSDAVIVGQSSPRLPQTSNIAFVGLDRQALVMAFDLAGVACSTGSACASGSSEPSPTLLAMGLPEEQISSSIRFSLGATTTAEEIDEAARRILAVCNRLRAEK